MIDTEEYELDGSYRLFAEYARFLVPMAISLEFGLVFATAITLLLSPILYLIL